ncbi:hypothetical protein ABZX74_29155 [Streptomyces olivaceoviridis]|uniref:hypothetical protein n=1 Tax=Streptomyces olivaceoviridis TaxID=1921 RepID=UPI0033A66CF5
MTSLRGKHPARIRQTSVEEANQQFAKVCGDLPDISAVIDPGDAQTITLTGPSLRQRRLT